MFALLWHDAPPIEVLAAALPRNGRFWLDGTPDHVEGRWAFLGAEPVEVRRARFGEQRPLACFGDLGAADETLDGEPGELRAEELPWWVGYAAYDAAWSDPSVVGLRTSARHPRGPSPVVWLGRYERLIACDLAGNTTIVLAPSEDECREFCRTLSTAAAPPRASVGKVHAEPRTLHRAAIESALTAIAAGDIYQVNLARTWTCDVDGDPLALWLAMRRASPVPLGFYLDTDGAVLGRSMERFLRWQRSTRRLWTSPIKGTIARTGDRDELEASVLRADDKERAEHSMIVDLMRNDLSRIAEVGSVRVAAPLRVEPFASLNHLVSTVECRTRAGAGRPEILEATFPPGSITGTPKLRAMELIEREERRARGVYTGAVGYVDRAGGMSLAVAIRTATVENGKAVYFAGGGIVSASDPTREIAETELKARVFVEACAELRVQ